VLNRKKEKIGYNKGLSQVTLVYSFTFFLSWLAFICVNTLGSGAHGSVS